MTETMVTDGNATLNVANQNHPADGQWFPNDVRVGLLWMFFGMGVLGNLLVMLKLYINRRRKSRVNTIVLGIASADMSVCVFAILPSIMIEIYPEWNLGNFMCKIVMFLQGAALISTGNMVMLLAADRHQAVRNPLSAFYCAWKLVAIAWAIAGTFAVPQLIVWQTVSKHNMTRCGTKLSQQPVAKTLYLVYVSIITFFIPLVAMCVAYCRIFKKIHDKAMETSGKKSTKKGKMEMGRSGGTGALTKAKKKTLKMSIVIISTFIVCSVPFFVVEVVLIFLPSLIRQIGNLYALLSVMAVANSATNPYVFLLFNVTRGFLSELQNFFCPCCPAESPGTEYSRYSVKFSTSSNSHRNNHNNSKITNNDHVTKATDAVGSPKLVVKKTET